MLNINNQSDKEKMMQYHRTKDMINLITYFPELSPIRNLTIVDSLEDYLDNYDLCKNFPGERNDTLIIKPAMKSIEQTGINPNIVEIFPLVKEADSDGVIVLFDLCHSPSERYERYAGISIGVSIGKGIFIDAVGRGFDGREVSKGLSVHERYYIPWYELRKVCVTKFRDYRTYVISELDYIISRENRIKFLLSLGLDEELINNSVPLMYEEIPDFIWKDVITKLIKKLEKMEEELIAVGLNEFAVSGHTEGKQFLPWQLFDKSRYILKNR